MNGLFSSIFSNKLDIDDRSPILSISLGGNEWGLFPPHILFWAQLAVVVFIGGTFSALIASIIYTVIIPRKNSFISFLVGFGVIIPTVLYFPCWLSHFLDIRNKLILFCLCAIHPVLTMFRTSEAVFGFSPHSVESSLTNYALYYAAGVEVKFDKVTNRPIKATFDDKMNALKNFGFYATLLGAYKSLFGPCRYEPFETNANGNNPGYDLKDIFDFNLLRNNAVSTLMLQLYLSAFLSALLAIVSILLGFKVKDGMMDNPMLKATSPTDFWAGRWNVLVHGALKRGVFKPVYKFSSRFIAVLATFLASGLFHDFILFAIHPAHLGFKPDLGKNTVFMMWNAGVIVIESMIGKAQIFSYMKNNLPKPFVTTLVLCTALPVAHWFLHPYSKSEVFVHGELAMPMIKRLG